MRAQAAFAIALLLALVVSSDASAKCKWRIDDEAHFQTKDMKLAEANRSVIAVELGFEDGRYYLGAIYASQFKGGVMQVDKDTPLTFHFEGRDPIQISPVLDAETKRTVLGIAILRKKTTTRFQLTDDEFDALNEHPVSKVRITFKSDGKIHHQDFVVKPRGARQFSELANCLYEKSASLETA